MSMARRAPRPTTAAWSVGSERSSGLRVEGATPMAFAAWRRLTGASVTAATMVVKIGSHNGRRGREEGEEHGVASRQGEQSESRREGPIRTDHHHPPHQSAVA